MQCTCGAELRRDNRSGACRLCYVDGHGPLSVPLTDREKQILQLVADGNSGDSASVKLDPPLTEQMVKNRLRFIRRKLDATTTTEACCKALRQGLLV
jgi:DNA-binding NarL/FixJ family response regulator